MNAVWQASDRVRREIDADGAAGLKYLRFEATFYERLKQGKGKGKNLDLRKYCKAVEEIMNYFVLNDRMEITYESWLGELNRDRWEYKKAFMALVDSGYINFEDRQKDLSYRKKRST